MSEVENGTLIMFPHEVCDLFSHLSIEFVFESAALTEFLKATFQHVLSRRECKRAQE